ncbi:two-component regulator propeller domain-containing protein [Pedobacter lithocola]|uniref:histidine kinase n=1 Tax=Pedobacter lithocola TaxID=1908239 RepID=A0ABV8PF51_9SPHI
MFRNLFTAIFLSLFIVTKIWAQADHYQFSQLTILNGLSNNQVLSIYQDKKGFMWFGTFSGLNRYDGHKFRVFKHDFHDPNSLSDDFVSAIFAGPNDKMWIQTKQNYNIYDPYTERFERTPKAYLASIGLPDAEIKSIKSDGKGNFWFVYANLGIYKYNEISKQSKHFYNSKGLGSIYSSDVTSLSLNEKGQAWIVYNDGTVDLFEPKLNKVVYRSSILRNANHGKSISYSVFADKDNDLWFFTTSTSLGVYYFNPEKNILKHFDKDGTQGKFRSNIVYNVIQDNKGLIWIGTDHGGITIVDKKDFKVTYLLNQDYNQKSIAQNAIPSLFKDQMGVIWAGTFKKGISYYHENIIKFPQYKHNVLDKNSLPFDDVNRFAEDELGNLWIGTNGGGLLYFDRKQNTYTKYKHDPQNPNSISSDIVVSLLVGHDGKLWIGTYWGGLDCFDGKKFEHFKHDETKPGSISDDRVWKIFEDSSKQLWVGTLAGGLNLFDRSTKTFRHYGPEKKNSITFGYVPALFEDSNKNLWVGGWGIDVLNLITGKFKHFTRNLKNPYSLVQNNVSSIIEDSRKLIWIGTREGLSVYDPSTAKFNNFRKENGLPDNTILGILEDDDNNVWLSTANGISMVKVSRKEGKYLLRFQYFDVSDGLQGKEFNENAAYKTKSGELIFGGANGFNIFKPSKIQITKNKINLVFTDFQVFNKSVKPKESVEGHLLLQKSITETDNIELKHNENAFGIEFAALNFFNSKKLTYHYMMRGFDKKWIDAENDIRKASYTNLNPGNYEFLVRVIDPDVPGSFEDRSLKIQILPPFWKTNLAYLLYFLILSGLLLYIRYRGIQKLKKEFAIEQERAENKHILAAERQDAERIHELDLMKIKFLTNVSHEFRTPISLIMAPADKMLQNAESPDQKHQIQIIKRNAYRLLSLVNQLLDFRKLEVQELKFHGTPGDIVQFIAEIVQSFSDVAEAKQIGFDFDSEVEQYHTEFDHDKIERIIFNLLSNAFKFTQAGGHVTVLLSLKSNTPNTECSILEIKIIDTGIGIPEEKLNKIFERFYQNDVPSSILNQGSGIGLSIVKEFVNIHSGEISVESEVNQGSCFTINLQLKRSKHILNVNNKTAAENSLPVAKKKIDLRKPKILLVEDNEDFRFYLKDSLKDIFSIQDAANGKDGWQKALALHPDLIVSDINMPEMSGTELCRKIKNDVRTAHIPFILLTALSEETEQVKGLELGANDYLTKPFNFEILISKIKNLLILQENFKKTYTKHLQVNLPEIERQSHDEKFIANVLKYVENNIVNPNLSVEELSKQMNMSRVSLYKKILLLTGKSPVEFIRSYRLQKAAQLFEKSQLNVVEVSYEVGFNTPNYFSKSFKTEFKMLPSEYIALLRKKDLN